MKVTGGHSDYCDHKFGPFNLLIVIPLRQSGGEQYL